jgi:hypothetical protein
MFMPKAGMSNPERFLDFYEVPENELYQMANSHYVGWHTPLSGFSSWAASLHSVLCYATYLRTSTTHVAVMDTHNIKDDVLVWHVPHLISGSNQEYLAYGRIQGPGYRAVSLDALEQHGLLEVFTELRGGITDAFGDGIRRVMFASAAIRLEERMIKLVKNIGSLFGALSFPVVTALVCLQPRVWRGWRKEGDMSGQLANISQCIAKLVNALGMSSVPVGLLQEPWLRAGMVDTTTFPDVEQWISLMAWIAEHSSHKAEPNWNRIDVEKDGIPRLRPLPDMTYRSCKYQDCGKCISCVAGRPLK